MSDSLKGIYRSITVITLKIGSLVQNVITIQQFFLDDVGVDKKDIIDVLARDFEQARAINVE